MEQNSIILIFLIIAIVIIIILLYFLKRDTSAKIYDRVLEIEKENQFIEKIKILKNKIDEESEKQLNERISVRRESLIEDAIKRSSSVVKGKVIEHFAPFMLPEFFNPDEIVFMGSPIDLISFTNVDNGENISIDFLEIKTGNSSLRTFCSAHSFLGNPIERAYVLSVNLDIII